MFNDDLLRLVYYRGRSISDLTVRAWPVVTRYGAFSAYSHVAIMRGNHKIESKPFVGVQEVMWNEFYNPFHLTCIADVFEIKELTPEQASIGWAFLQEQKGKKYDFKGIFGYATKMYFQDPNDWFCSELAERMSEVITMKLTPTYKPHQVDPQLQAGSKLLVLKASFTTTCAKLGTF